MLRPKPILAICAMLALAAVVYLSAKRGHRYGADSHHHSTTVVKQPPTAKGHWHGDVWHDETHDTPGPVATPPEPVATPPEPVATPPEPVVDTVDPDDAEPRHEWFLRAYADDPDQAELYNFYTENPNFVFETAGKELQTQWTEIVYRVAVKMRATAAKKEALWEQSAKELAELEHKIQAAERERLKKRKVSLPPAREGGK